MLDIKPKSLHSSIVSQGKGNSVLPPPALRLVQSYQWSTLCLGVRQRGEHSTAQQ